MWRPRRRPKVPALTAGQWLTAIKSAIDGSTVHHEHVVRQEPIPAPVRAEVVIKRPDNSDAWRGHIQCGRGAVTLMPVPLANIDRRFAAGDAMTFEFRWVR